MEEIQRTILEADVDITRSSHNRHTSEAVSESDSSISSPEALLDEDTDFFMMQANDSQSSLGVPNIREMSVSIDLERQHRISPISKLPPELLLSILARLTTSADLRSCMLVSYHWAAHTVGILWHRPLCNKVTNLINVTSSLSSGAGFFPYQDLVKRLNLSALADKVNDGTAQAFMHCKRIERLTLTNCANLTDQGVSMLVDGNRHLQALDVTDLSSLTDHTLFTVAASCPRLQGLNITNCAQITDDSLIAVSEHCRQLKRLKLNNVNKATDISVTSFARNCRSILEIDLHSCSRISSESVTALLANLSHLRELRLAHCGEISDSAFLNLPPRLVFDSLRILDLTGCEHVRDDAIARIIPAAPRLRNLVLAKCKNITDRAVMAICRLTKNLHYIHLGHCVNLSDAAIIALVKACNRIRYIDLACCYRLTDASVQHLAQLPKLRRIGLVKCQQLTDRSIVALARGPIIQHGKITGVPISCSLERVHLSYCVNLTLQGIHALLHHCPRLTHLSLTGVQAFLREDLTRFCRDAPPEFTHPQRDVFCVFSGDGVTRLRDYLNRLAMDQAEREGREEAMEESVIDGDESAGADTISEDETVGEEGSDETVIGLRQPEIPMVNFPPASAPAPTSVSRAFHVDMPFLPAELMERMGPLTPLGSLTPQRGVSPAPSSFLGGTMYHHDPEYRYRPQSPSFDDGDGDDERDPSRGPSRRHTLESAMDFFGPVGGSGSNTSGPSPRPLEGDRRRSFFGHHATLMPSMFSGGRRGNSRTRDGRMLQDDQINLTDAAGDLVSPYHGIQRGESSRREPRPRSRPRMYGLHGPRLPSWGSSSRIDERPRLPEEERRAIVREMEVAQQQMEGIEHSQVIMPPLERSGSAMMEDNHQFLRESTGVGEAVPRTNHNLVVPSDHSLGLLPNERPEDMVQ